MKIPYESIKFDATTLIKLIESLSLQELTPLLFQEISAIKELVTNDGVENDLEKIRFSSIVIKNIVATTVKSSDFPGVLRTMSELCLLLAELEDLFGKMRMNG